MMPGSGWAVCTLHSRPWRSGRQIDPCLIGGLLRLLDPVVELGLVGDGVLGVGLETVVGAVGLAGVRSLRSPGMALKGACSTCFG